MMRLRVPLFCLMSSCFATHPHPRSRCPTLWLCWVQGVFRCKFLRTASRSRVLWFTLSVRLPMACPPPPPPPSPPPPSHSLSSFGFWHSSFSSSFMTSRFRISRPSRHGVFVLRGMPHITSHRNQLRFTQHNGMVECRNQGTID